MSPCIDPTGRKEKEKKKKQTTKQETVEEVTTVQKQASVGGEAPDFEATALIDGDFEDVKLSDYAGQWVVLCFFPADFTFV